MRTKTSFRRGRSGNPQGRRRGVPNRITGELRLVIRDFIEREANNFPRLLKNLDPYQRAQIFVRLLEFAIPRLSHVTVPELQTRKIIVDICDDGDDAPPPALPSPTGPAPAAAPEALPAATAVPEAPGRKQSPTERAQAQRDQNRVMAAEAYQRRIVKRPGTMPGMEIIGDDDE